MLMEVRLIKLMDVPLRPDSASSRCSKPQIRESFWIDPANEPSEPSHAPQFPTCALRRSCGYGQATFFSMSVFRHSAPCPDGRRKREGFQGFLRRLLGLINLTSALLSEPPFLPLCSGRPLRRALTDESAHIMRLLRRDSRAMDSCSCDSRNRCLGCFSPGKVGCEGRRMRVRRMRCLFLLSIRSEVVTGIHRSFLEDPGGGGRS